MFLKALKLVLVGNYFTKHSLKGESRLVWFNLACFKQILLMGYSAIHLCKLLYSRIYE